jgi:DNA-binding CsgD family transcriptional regulator
MQKTTQREQARAPRSTKGLSIKEIARILGISQASASVWVRDVELTDAQRRALIERARIRRNRSRSQHFRHRRLRFQRDGRRRARAQNPFHAAGCMLYWAEGSKSRNAAQFVNSDPAMVRFFVDFLRHEYGIPDSDFRIDCNLFADHLERQCEIEQFWLDTLMFPRSCLRKSTVNVYSKHSQKKRQNKLPYGTVRVVVHSTAVVQSTYGAIPEYGGFERPEWL